MSALYCDRITTLITVLPDQAPDGKLLKAGLPGLTDALPDENDRLKWLLIFCCGIIRLGGYP